MITEALIAIVSLSPTIIEDQSQQVSSHQSNVTVRGFWENDGAFHDPTDGHDRHYTNGFGFAYLAPSDTLKEWLGDTATFDIVDGKPNSLQAVFGLTAGQLMQTPADLRSEATVLGDAPYAGYLYIGGFAQRIAHWEDQPQVSSLEHFQVDVGILGPSSAGEEFQEWVHNNVTGVDPEGWSNQLEDTPMVQLTYRRKWRVFNGDAQGWGWDAIPEAALSIGTLQQYIEIGGAVRYGWQLPHDFGVARLFDPGTFAHQQQGHSLYGYTRVAGRYIWEDALVEGPNGNRPSGIHLQNQQAQFTLGVAWRVQRSNYHYELGYSLTFASKSFEESTGTDSWGALAVGVACYW